MWTHTPNFLAVAHGLSTYIVMAFIVIADVVMAVAHGLSTYIAMAYIAMADIAMAVAHGLSI